jgi:hypothetical protein
MHQLARLLCEARSSREINMVLQLGVSALCRGGAPTCFDQCLPCVAGCMRIERQVALLHLQPQGTQCRVEPANTYAAAVYGNAGLGLPTQTAKPKVILSRM